MLGVFAEFETNLRKERQLEGIAIGEGSRRLQGVPSVDRRGPGASAEGGGAFGPSKIAKALRIGRASVHRALAAW
jgi:DNA invertase Pin-like site-specific DNA recombinase